MRSVPIFTPDLYIFSCLMCKYLYIYISIYISIYKCSEMSVLFLLLHTGPKLRKLALSLFVRSTVCRNRCKRTLSLRLMMLISGYLGAKSQHS